MKTLLIEEDESSGATIAQKLRDQGHTVEWVKSGDEARLLCGAVHYEVIAFSTKMT